MMRLLFTLALTTTLLSGSISGCFPRHPPHTPQPVPDMPGQKDRPPDQRS